MTIFELARGALSRSASRRSRTAPGTAPRPPSRAPARIAARLGLLAIGILDACGVLMAAEPVAPLRFELALSQALANRLAAEAAELEVDRYRASLAEAQGEYQPEVTLEASLNRVDNFDQFTGITVYGVFDRPLEVQRTVPKYDTDIELRAIYDLYKGGGRTARVSAARGELAAAQARLDQTRRDVLLEVSSAYWQLMRLTLRYEHARQAEALAEAEDRFAARQFELGRLAEVEMAEKHLELRRRQADVRRLQLDREDAYRAYLRALGVDENRASQVPVDLGGLARSADITDPRTLLEPYLVPSNPEVREAAANASSARARIREERASFLPTLSLYAAYRAVGRDDDSLGSAVSDLKSADVSVGLLLSWNLFDGLRTSNRVKEANAEAARSAVLLGEQRQALAHDAAAKRQSIEILASELRLAEAELEMARKKLAVMGRRHAAGNASDLDRQGAQLAVDEAETDWLVARIDLTEAQIEYLLRFTDAPSLPARG